MDFFEDILKGAQDAIKPRNLAMLLTALVIVTFYVRSELPGAARTRDFVGLS